MVKGNKIKIEIIADEYFSADALREIANFIETAEDDEEIYGAKFKNANYTARIELHERAFRERLTEHDLAALAELRDKLTRQ